MQEETKPGRSGAVLAAVLGGCAAMAAVAPARMAAGIMIPVLAAPASLWTIAARERWVILFLSAALLLPPLPFAFGDSGPHPALAVAALGLLAGVLRPADWQLRGSVLASALAVYITVLLASVAGAVLYSGAAVASASLVRVGLFGISLYVFFYAAHGPGAWPGRDPLRTTRLLYWAGVAGTIFAVLDFCFQFPAPAGFGPQFVWLDSGVYRRAQGLFYEASTLGNFCAFFLVMIAVALARPRQAPVSRLALIAGGAAFSAALLLSFSRASVLNVAAALGALCVLERRRIPAGRVAVMLGVCAAAGATTVYFAFRPFAEAWWLRLQASAQYLLSAPDGVLSGRPGNWSHLLQLVAERPWLLLFGAGYKTLPYSTYLGRPVIADNMYISILVETGVVGLAALLALNGAILVSAWRAARNSDPKTAFFGAWVFCFWVGEALQMMSGDLLTYWRVLPLYFWVLAVAVRSSPEPA